MGQKSGALQRNLMTEFYIFGASLAAINAIRILLKNGQRVCWQKMGERPLGHFGGIKLGDDLIDLGMVFFEYGSINSTKPQTSRFPEIHGALNALFPMMEVRPAVVKSFHGGLLFDDIIIADNINKIKDQHRATKPILHHPREKWSNDYFEEHSYEMVCLAMFPEFYDKYLRCFAEKITSSRQNYLSARYHRTAWLPMYYPETIAATTKNFRSYPFHRPQRNSIASHMQSIVQDIESNPDCFISDTPDNFSLKQKLNNLYDVPRKNIILCCRPEKLWPAWNEQTRPHIIHQRLNIGFFRVKKLTELEIDCINDLDHPYIFRVFIQDSDPVNDYFIISVEFSGNWKNSDAAEAKVQEYLTSIDIFFDIEPIKMMLGISGPSFPRVGAERKFEILASKIHEMYKGCIIHGLSNGFSHTSMNAQIIATSRTGE